MTPARRLHEQDPEPVVVSADDLPAVDSVPPTAAAQPTGILLVDDHRENLAALEAVLEPLGEPLISVDSGEEALRVLLHRDVAVILLDVRMAGIDGVETARIIRSRAATRHIPIVFLTALVSDVEQIARAYATGAVDYVIKPFEPSILRAKVTAFVSLSRERAERLRESRARARAESAARAVQTLQALSDATLLHLELDRLADELLERACSLFAADAAALLLSEGDTTELVPFATRGPEISLSAEAFEPQGALAALLAARRGELLTAGSDAWAELLGASPGASFGALGRLLAVPLAFDGRALGLLLIGAVDDDAFDDADLELLALAGDRIGIAIDHARRFEHERELVEALQLSLLPERLPTHARLEMAARYLPSGSGAHIGGDWYDAVQLDHNRFALIIGDVVGHGIRAAARMGELRNALRAYATEGHSPGVALHRLDRLVKVTVGAEMVATVIFAVLDVGEGTVTLARAGHPPAMVRGADGVVRALETGRTLPVGLIGAHVPADLTHVLAAGETLLLYTDGLVERRGETIDAGMDRLAGVLSAAPTDPEETCAALVRGLLREQRLSRDDVALLAVRLRELAPGRLSLTLPATSQSIPAARHALRDWLVANAPDLDRVARGDLEVAFSEACTNVVRHAYGPGEATFIAGAERDGGALVLTVEDRGRWRPPRGEHGGRGLALMRTLCHELRVDKGPQGTVVELRYVIEPVAPDGGPVAP